MQRIYSIDTFKVIAIFFIICLHTHPFEGWWGNYAYYTMDKLFGFAVPYFFLASGFLLGAKYLRNPENILQNTIESCKRLMVLFLVWTVIYAILISVYKVNFTMGIVENIQLLYNDLVDFVKIKPIDVFLQGSIGTLWFLPALAMGQFIVGILAHHKKVYLILPIGILLYAFALLGGSYSKYSFGIAEVGIDTRNGPFVSTLFVGIGWLIASTKWWVHTRNKQLVALFLLFFGMLIHMTESYLIYINYYSMFYFDYVVGTVIYSLGVFLLSLTLPNLGRNTLSYIGPLVLGVYLTHQFILNFIKVGRHWLLQYVFTPAGWELFLPVMVLIASVLFTLSLKRIRLTNNLVS